MARVQLHADLCILGRLALALHRVRAQAVPLAAWRVFFNPPMRAFLLIVAIASILSVGSANAASSRDALIRPGVGIGKVRLGMTLTQVRLALGRHDHGWSERRGLGRRYLELAWDGGPEDYFSVAFFGRPGQLRAISMWTTQRRERTRLGFGPGSSPARLLRRVRGLRCYEVSPRVGGRSVRFELVLGGRGGPVTAFVLGSERSSRYGPGRQIIGHVIVRNPGTEPHLQFRPRPCRLFVGG